MGTISYLQGRRTYWDADKQKSFDVLLTKRLKINAAKKKIKTGIVGFGLSGRVFHAPFISIHNGFKLHSIVSSGNVAKQNYPKAKVFNDFLSLINNPEIELVVICTPHLIHAEQAAMALEKANTW